MRAAPFALALLVAALGVACGDDGGEATDAEVEAIPDPDPESTNFRKAQRTR